MKNLPVVTLVGGPANGKQLKGMDNYPWPSLVCPVDGAVGESVVYVRDRYGSRHPLLPDSRRGGYGWVTEVWALDERHREIRMAIARAREARLAGVHAGDLDAAAVELMKPDPDVPLAAQEGRSQVADSQDV